MAAPDSIRGLVITVAGFHGSGRSTQARLISETFGLRYISSGMIFRERAKELGVSLEEMNRIATEDDDFDRYIDNRTKEESQKGGVVIDANLSAWMAETPDLRFFLRASLEDRVRRIAEREERDFDEVLHETETREKMELERYLKYYNVDISDLSVYDLIVNTSLYGIDSTARILKKAIEEYVSSR
jgi:cytidylate kinase